MQIPISAELISSGVFPTILVEDFKGEGQPFVISEWASGSTGFESTRAGMDDPVVLMAGGENGTLELCKPYSKLSFFVKLDIGDYAEGATIIEFLNGSTSLMSATLSNPSGGINFKHGDAHTPVHVPGFSGSVQSLWLDYEAGSGANGKLDIYKEFDKDYQAAITDGLSTLPVTKVKLSSGIAGVSIYFDNLILAESTIPVDTSLIV